MFHAAWSGRGSHVTRMVSSMSLTTPRAVRPSTTRTRDSTGWRPRTATLASCHPGASSVRIGSMDVAAAIRRQHVRAPPDDHRHVDADRRDGEQRSPTARRQRPAVPSGVRFDGRGEQDPSEHADRARVAVPDRRRDPRGPAATPHQSPERLIERLLEAGGNVSTAIWTSHGSQRTEVPSAAVPGAPAPRIHPSTWCHRSR